MRDEWLDHDGVDDDDVGDESAHDDDVGDESAHDDLVLFDGPPCPACGVEMQPDGVDTADGLESCHRCPRCKMVLGIPGY